jgi:MarR family transcriptional regulator, organic hydroperoxide resistance regulator
MSLRKAAVNAAGRAANIGDNRCHPPGFMKKNSRSRRVRGELNIAVLKSFRVIYGSVRHQFREVERTCGISGSQLWILHELSTASGIGVSELAAKLAIHQSTCSQLVDKLVRAGLVTKDRQSQDQRRVELAVSARGKRTLARAPGPAEGVLTEAIAELTAKEVNALFHSLRQVIAALDMKDEGAAGTPLADL